MDLPGGESRRRPPQLWRRAECFCTLSFYPKARHRPIIHWLMMVMVALVGALLLAPPAHADSPVRPAQARAGDLPWNPNGLHGPVSLTHNVSLEVQPENSQACGSTQGGYTSQNSFWRVFDLNGQF